MKQTRALACKDVGARARTHRAAVRPEDANSDCELNAHALWSSRGGSINIQQRPGQCSVNGRQQDLCSDRSWMRNGMWSFRRGMNAFCCSSSPDRVCIAVIEWHLQSISEPIKLFCRFWHWTFRKDMCVFYSAPLECTWLHFVIYPKAEL